MQKMCWARKFSTNGHGFLQRDEITHHQFTASFSEAHASSISKFCYLIKLIGNARPKANPSNVLLDK